MNVERPERGREFGFVKLGVSPLAEYQGTSVRERPEAFHLGDEEDVIAPRVCRPSATFKHSSDSRQQRRAEQSFRVGGPFPFVAAGLGETVRQILLILSQH